MHKIKSFVMQCDVSCFRSLGIPIETESNCSIVNMGASNPLLNCVYVNSTNNSQFELTVQKITHRFHELNLPHSWWVETDSKLPTLKYVLENFGLSQLDTFPGMALDLCSIQKIPAVDKLTFERVSTPIDFDDWSALIGKAYQFNEPDTKLYTSFFIKAETDGPFFHLAGKKNGKVVSIGTLLCTGQGAYIYNIATTKEEQGKGYGTSMTHALLQIAKQKNQTRAALISSPEAASIYRKLGFQDVCQFNIYAPIWTLPYPQKAF